MIRVGIGYDIHRLEHGRPLVLGGVHFISDVGLVGHSDGDVILHALMDALLGAAALGDIGLHFPPTDDQFRGAASLGLLRRVRELIAQAGFSVVNADIVVVAEMPPINPHRTAMRENIAEALRADSGQIGLKATTNEGVGPEGRCEAISAHAVALLETIQ